MSSGVSASRAFYLITCSVPILLYRLFPWYFDIHRALAAGTIAEYWARDLPMIIACIICEIVLLGITAVRTACAIASEFGYRLYPLNAERYFVATSLIRACFGEHNIAFLHIGAYLTRNAKYFQIQPIRSYGLDT